MTLCRIASGISNLVDICIIDYEQYCVENLAPACDGLSNTSTPHPPPPYPSW